jgi:hypothetical protein
MSTRGLTSTSGRRLVVAFTSLGLVALGMACVDLFHSTDFETLCTKSPDDPLCGASDGAAPKADVVVAADADAARPHPNFCAWTSAEAEKQAARACAWLGACERPLGESLFGACVIHAQLAYDCTANPSLRPRLASDDFWSCLATVQSCGDVDRCVFPAGVQGCRAVATGTSTACGTQGNEAVHLECAGPAGRAHGVEPCALLGRTCASDDAGSARCAGVQGFECSTDAGACSGTSAVDCKPSGTRFIDQGVDCAGLGAGKCAIGEAGATCVPTPSANTCLEDSAPTCDGSIARVCLGGQDIRIDCAALGLKCDAGGVSTVEPSAACVTGGVGACADNDVCPTSMTLQSCGRGGTYTVDCASVGLGKCVIDVTGHGACTPPP